MWEVVVEQALASGADFGIKIATSGALKVSVEKEIIKFIPKGTPAKTLAKVAHIAIEKKEAEIGAAVGMAVMPQLDRKTQKMLKKAGRKLVNFAENSYENVINII